jgi:microfibrillar-associated protein 1
MDSRLQRLQEAKAKNSSSGRQRFTAQIISSSTPTDNKEDFTQQNTTLAPESTETPAHITTPHESSSSSSDSSDSDLDDLELERLSNSRPSFANVKPVFVSKEQRTSEKASDSLTTFATQPGNREESRAFVAQLLRREFEAANAAAKSSQVPDALTGAFNPAFVDDTDDPNSFDEEYLSWRLRELLRIKAERHDRQAQDLEMAERERIRNMTEEEKRKIDQEKLDEWTRNASSTEYKFLQKYYHKGAFYQEEHKEILSRDYAQATGSDRSDKDVLPQILQVKHFGKKGKSKWKHLTAEDTTAFDYGWGAKDNAVNFKSVAKMGGMRGDLDNPSKKHKK